MTTWGWNSGYKKAAIELAKPFLGKPIIVLEHSQPKRSLFGVR